MQLNIHEFDLPLRHVFTISRESIAVQKTLIVELEEEGVRGYGEATTNDYYGFTFQNMAAALERVRPKLKQRSLDDPVALWDDLHEALKDNPFAHCALDQAAYDLWGKKQNRPVHELWGLATDRLPVSNYTIGIDTLEVMVAKLQEFPDWPVYKVKLGTDHDLDIIRQLRQHTPSVFRVDANGGWTANEAIQNAHALQQWNVEFLEQPLPADRSQEMKQVRAESPLPVIADESCIVPADVDRCRDGFHGINIKLVKCGGLTPARRMIERARELELKVMVGCMTESSVGISAIAQLLPLLDYVDMDGALLLARDIADGVTLDQGHCQYPSTPGNGVTLRGES